VLTLTVTFVERRVYTVNVRIVCNVLFDNNVFDNVCLMDFMTVDR